MPRFRNLLSAAVFALWGFFLVLIASGYVAAKEITPTDNFCRVINDPMSGNEVTLNPGVYRGPCTIRRGGEPDRPLIIRAKSETDRPRINYDGNSANVLEVRADHVIIKGLAFGPTHVDAIRIRANKDVTVIDCEFVEIGGIAVVANQSSLKGLVVSRNRVRDSRSTAMYFGCHDGYACRMSGIIIEKNRIDGVTAAVNEIGYGIQVKLNSAAIIRDNAIKDTKGPGIMVYGAHDTSTESLIERNFVSGSRTSSGIVIGGGPAIVRNNIALFSVVSGIGLEDYGQRVCLGTLSSALIRFTAIK